MRLITLKKVKRVIFFSQLSLMPSGCSFTGLHFMRTLALPEPVAHWSLTSLREKLVKIGAKIVAHSRYVTF